MDDSICNGSQHQWQIKLHLDGIVSNIDPTGDFLAQCSTFEMQSISFPSIQERNHSAYTAGELLLHATEAYGDATYVLRPFPRHAEC